MTVLGGRVRLEYLLLVWSVIQVVLVNCQAPKPRTQILCANRKDIWRVDAETKGQTLVVDSLKRSVAVDYHYKKDLVVWTDVSEEKIYSTSLKTGVRTVLVPNCTTPDGVAVDWIHDKVYWTDTGRNVIGVVELDGTKMQILFSRNVDEPRAIVLNPEEGWMFWSDWGSSAKIERSGMDGTHRSVIISRNIQWPNGLAIDLPTRRIFWADGKTHVLCSADYDGNGVRVIIDSPTVMKHPFSLDVFEDWLYWTEWSAFKESVYKADKLTGKNITKIIGGPEWTSLMGIRVYHPDKHPPSPNRCEHVTCPYLCLPAPKVSDLYPVKFTCVCPAGSPCSAITRVPSISTTAFTTPSTTTSTPSTTTATPSTTTTKPRRTTITLGTIANTPRVPSISTTAFTSPSATTSTPSTTTTTPSRTTITIGTIANTPSITTTSTPISIAKFDPMDEWSYLNDSQRQVQEESYSSAASTSSIVIGVACGTVIIALVAFYVYKRHLRRTPVSSRRFENPVYDNTTEDIL